MEEGLSRQIDLSTNQPWRSAVGGMWDEIGKLQFDFLVSRGLCPNHNFLDVGCGSLRGGIHFISYLQDRNYYGIDRNGSLLKAGIEHEIPSAGLENRHFNLYENADFDFSHFDVNFDFGIAQSVFTHLPSEIILKCLSQLKKVLKLDAKFFATFFEITTEQLKMNSVIHTPGGIKTNPDRDPYHYTLEQMEALARKAGLRITYIGNWHHPRSQNMLLFQHDSC